MANVKEAVYFVLRLEDESLSGEVTNKPLDRGGLTRFGLTSRWHPELVQRGFFETDRDTALAIAVDVYSTEYIPHFDLRKVDRTAVAIAVLAFGVVAGGGTSILLLQRTLNRMGFGLAVDGTVGSMTMTALNAADPFNLVGLLVSAQKAHFQSIVDKDPTQQRWLSGWNNRSDKVMQYAKRTLLQ